MKLEVEIVPKSCWYSNVRSEVRPAIWNKIRKKTYLLANNMCEVCGKISRLECHEIWSYENNTQKLIGLVALCNLCHLCKHPGFAESKGWSEKMFKHLAKVNQLNVKETNIYLHQCWALWGIRSNQEWQLDISWLDEFLKD